MIYCRMKMSKESGINRVLWLIIGAVISGAVGLGYIYIQSNFLQQTPKLMFSSINSIPFEGEENNIGIYHVEVFNDGKTTIHNIDCVIIIEGSKIEDYILSVEPSISYNEIQIEDTFYLNIPMLNSEERISVSLLTTSIGALPTKPVVSLRGEGVTGSEFTGASESEIKQIFGNYSLIISAVGAIISIMIGYFYWSKESEERIIIRDNKVD